ncbi:hypothetical protein SISSUDRAFT_1054294 [Sistotremastrum suecicum HHB10207 ss-3]|uniref:Uncharacterized protein n=1 Tax=Sistotremastrum suecicum HHB10207 ss-3 TaxID=1314776 RepID=A0A165YLS6_9AGAM|nr:hypothetical protein SISSUDRAFT_1054294 [Sistotremastrum suecicum HHB10207 ss-3]
MTRLLGTCYRPVDMLNTIVWSSVDVSLKSYSWTHSTHVDRKVKKSIKIGNSSRPTHPNLRSAIIRTSESGEADFVVVEEVEKERAVVRRMSSEVKDPAHECFGENDGDVGNSKKTGQEPKIKNPTLNDIRVSVYRVPLPLARINPDLRSQR